MYFQATIRLALLYSVSGILPHDVHLNASTNKPFMSIAMGQYMPRGKHLETKRLLRRLGSDFDPEWMSVELPRIANNVPPASSHVSSIQTGLLINKLDYLLDSHAENLKLNNQSREIVKNFLQTMSNCQIQFEWEDFGNLIWPRYLLTGTCMGSWSCSWPLGMYCRTTEVKNLHVLKWRCINAKNKRKVKKKSTKKTNITNGSVKGKPIRKRKNDLFGRKLKCRWKKVPHVADVKCDCSC